MADCREPGCMAKIRLNMNYIDFVPIQFRKRKCILKKRRKKTFSLIALLLLFSNSLNE